MSIKVSLTRVLSPEKRPVFTVSRLTYLNAFANIASQPGTINLLRLFHDSLIYEDIDL